MLAQTCVAIVALLSVGHAKPTTKLLQHDDVVVAGSDGSIVVMKDFEYELKEARETLKRRKVDPVHVTPRQESHANQRRCDESVEYQVLSVSKRLDEIITPYTARWYRQIVFTNKFPSHVCTVTPHALAYCWLTLHIAGHKL